MLLTAMHGVASQLTEDLFNFEIIIVDNDSGKTAENLVKQFRLNTKIEIIYACEPVQNIALARNRALLNARGNLVAFIDDDECPIKAWLLHLYKALKLYNANGVMGPVMPYFDRKPPSWIIKGKFCDRPSPPTGTILHWDNTRTGNVLMDKSIYSDLMIEFDPIFGRSGGEDIDFFRRAIQRGKIFVWCKEAPVLETVISDRLKASFYIKKNLRIGGLNGSRKRKEAANKIIILKNFFGSILYFSFFIVSIPIGKHLYLKYVCKLSYNLSWFLGYFFHILLLSNKNDK